MKIQISFDDILTIKDSQIKLGFCFWNWREGKKYVIHQII